MKIIFIILFSAFIFIGPLYGQKISNVEVKLAGSMVQVNYVLEGFKYGQDYEVYLYSSHNNYAQPLQFVTGDVGQKVKGDGNVKIITWDARTELGAYNNKISVELRGKPFVPFLVLKTPLSGENFKKGKSYTIEWEGAQQVNELDIQLINDTEATPVIKNLPNKNIYNWRIPKNLKSGKGYRFKVSNSANATDYILTDPFAIKQKFPVVLLFTPLLGGIYFLIPSTEPPVVDTGIPDPPLPE